MSYCNVEWDEDNGYWQCTICGTIYWYPHNYSYLSVECPAASPVQQFKNYAVAVTQHIATGMGTRTDAEVNDILAICQQCEHFNITGGYCRICGCRCNANKSPFTNKLRMKSQKCPKGKWE